MKSRQQNIDLSAVPYIGDEYRLYASAKAVTYSVLSLLGVAVSQSNDSVVSENNLRIQSETPSEDSLIFLMKCLVACLDCHCDIGDKSSKPIMSSLCTYIAITFSHACRLRSSTGSNPEHAVFAPAIEALGKVSTRLTSHTFKRCFSVITSGPLFGAETDVCFRSLLAAIRGAALLAGLVHRQSTGIGSEPMNAIASGQANTSHTEEDIWGGIDDDAFASIDLDALGGTDLQQEAAAPPLENLFSLFSEALLVSKVRQHEQNASIHELPIPNTLAPVCSLQSDFLLRISLMHLNLLPTGIQAQRQRD